MIKTEEERPQNAVLQMIMTMADTTWRMFVPIVGLLLLGVFADKSLHSVPWLTVLGFVLGVGVSALLVRNQFKKDSL
jgi:F0F1-type ATP synthase assembly protein I